MSSLRHDLDFLHFVTRYEEIHPGKELSYDEAIQLYTTYDVEWRNEVHEYLQTKRFVTDNAVQLIKGQDNEEA